VTDIEMPEMDGLDLCRRLRADVATRGIGVVVVTGDASDWIQAAALDAGCDVVLAKPQPDALAGDDSAIARRATSGLKGLRECAQ
jgi:CheY-like chemotaxis protein